ncbi:MAG: IclR family transcriptional regulator [Gemmatimonadota bacterium]
MKLRTTKGERQVTGAQAIGRAFSILRMFSDETPEWNLAELSRKVGLTKTTSFRLLGALEHERMVARNRPSGSYRLGPRAIELGSLAQRSNSLHRAAHEELIALSEATGETTSLEILIGTHVLVLDEIQGRHKLSPAPFIGSRWPAHTASTGKVLLAAAGGWPAGSPRPVRLTPQSITSVARLNAELAAVTKRGYAVAIEELEAGYVAVGAPVRNHHRSVVAAISAGGPSIRFTAQRIPRIAKAVCEAAERISQRLGAGREPRT